MLIFRQLMRNRLSLGLASVIVSYVTVLGAVGSVYAVSGQGIISLTNIQRQASGLSPLAWNSALSSSAYAKAQDMCAKGYWAHTSPDGTTGWTFMSQAGYPYIAAGENLAKDFATDDGVVAGWMASPGHRDNILNPAYIDIGVAAVPCPFQGVDTTIVVAHYGATRQAAAQPTPYEQPVDVPQPKTTSRPATSSRPITASAAAQSQDTQSQPVQASTEAAPKTEAQKPEAKQTSIGEKILELIKQFQSKPVVTKNT